MILLIFLTLLGSTSGDTLLPTWQVPFTQTTVLPASRVGASGIFNGSGVLIVGGTVNTVSAQSVPMAPSSFYATGALCLTIIRGFFSAGKGEGSLRGSQ